MRANVICALAGYLLRIEVMKPRVGTNDAECDRDDPVNAEAEHGGDASGEEEEFDERAPEPVGGEHGPR